MINDLKKVYEDWNKNSLTLENYEDFIEITTPFVDMHHDFIQLYFTIEADGSYRISDDGYILNELEMLGISIKSSRKRREFFKTNLNIFGVTLDKDHDELYIPFHSLSQYPESQNRLIQCVLRISDMLLTSRNTVVSIFTEEIANFFEEQDILFVESASFTGISGKPQNFDFTIPHSRKKNTKEKLIKAINSPSPDNYRDALFPWLDIQESKNKAEFIVLANDINKPLNESFLTPFQNYGVNVLPWSERQEWVKKLKTS